MNSITIESLKKNNKYRLIHNNGKHYIINLNRNKLSFILPLINYITPHPLKEINERELKDIKTANISKEEKDKNDSLIGWTAGIGSLIGILTKSIGDYMDFSTNFILNLVIVLLIIVPLLIFKIVINKKDKRKIDILIENAQQSAYVWPHFSILLSNILIGISSTIFLLATIYAFLFMTISNFSFIFLIAFLFFIILFQNNMLYSYVEIHGKMGEIKRK
ncbi:DUF443 family protein [Staphylococcus caprae]|uniref:DUF443 family protein n=1 Tax=Staphylococcus caprae TaxID=29380 RepID=UPI0030C59C82